MTFAVDGSLGRAVLVPCKRNPAEVEALVAESEALWKAEDRDAGPGSNAAPWGCIGVLFRDDRTSTDWSLAWAQHFQQQVSSPVPPVGRDGLLGIAWPMTVADDAADLDVILATATEAEATRPSPEDIADAWIKQNGGRECYFFGNIRHGIRTSEDLLIWKRIEEQRPQWLSGRAYAEAVAILRGEVNAARG
jgi:hypothetical protein